MADNNYHVSIIRGQLTRDLAFLFPEARDETLLAFNNEILLTDGMFHASCIAIEMSHLDFILDTSCCIQDDHAGRCESGQSGLRRIAEMYATESLKTFRNEKLTRC